MGRQSYRRCAGGENVITRSSLLKVRHSLVRGIEFHVQVTQRSR